MLAPNNTETRCTVQAKARDDGMQQWYNKHKSIYSYSVISRQKIDPTQDISSQPLVGELINEVCSSIRNIDRFFGSAEVLS